eukprot:6210125-Pleurochrysis_carterae.AAC.4
MYWDEPSESVASPSSPSGGFGHRRSSSDPTASSPLKCSTVLVNDPKHPGLNSQASCQPPPYISLDQSCGAVHSVPVSMLPATAVAAPRATTSDGCLRLSTSQRMSLPDAGHAHLGGPKSRPRHRRTVSADVTAIAAAARASLTSSSIP